jgi:hypothetical protein
MATRSNIAYKTPEGKIRSAYCHYDGYPEHNGEMLRRHYMDGDKVKMLVDLGDMSVLRPKVFPTNTTHSFETPEDDVTIFYGRDRGESGVGFREYDDFAEYVENGEEYMYFFDGNDWLVNDHQAKDDNGFPVFDYVEYKIRPDVLKQMGWED